MEYLRWIILVTGVVLILIIYLTNPARRKKTLHEDKIKAEDLPSIKTASHDLYHDQSPDR